MVKCLSTMREIRIQSLGWEDPLEKEMAIHSSTIAWEIPWIEEPGRLQSMGSQIVGHDWATSYGATDWLKIEKGVQQGCLLSPVCLTYTLSTTPGLDELQAGIKIGGRNINNFRYADDTTLMAESKEELKSLLMSVKKESDRASLKLNIKKRSWHLAPLLHGK